MRKDGDRKHAGESGSSPPKPQGWWSARQLQEKFVGGRIAPRIPTVLRDGRFVRAFNAKGRLESLLERMPVALLLDARIGLWGAATVALEAPSRAEL